jgi:hypothetical protein
MTQGLPGPGGRTGRGACLTPHACVESVPASEPRAVRRLRSAHRGRQAPLNSGTNSSPTEERPAAVAGRSPFARLPRRGREPVLEALFPQPLSRRADGAAESRRHENAGSQTIRH